MCVVVFKPMSISTEILWNYVGGWIVYDVYVALDVVMFPENLH